MSDCEKGALSYLSKEIQCIYLQRYDHMNENERIVHIMSGKMAVRWIKEIAFVYFWIARVQKEICNS